MLTSPSPDHLNAAHLNAPMCGALIGVVGTLLSANLATASMVLDLPDILPVWFFHRMRPWFLSAASITWLFIVCDNYNGISDFWHYTVPISLLLNTSIGGVVGHCIWFFRQTIPTKWHTL